MTITDPDLAATTGDETFGADPTDDPNLHVEQPLGEDDDLDAIDLDDDSDGAGSGDGATGSAAQAAAVRRGLNRGAIRRIAAKAEEVTKTKERIVEIAASLLGCGTGLAEITTAIMAAPRTAQSPIADLKIVAEADAMEAATFAAGMGRDRVKAMWSLLAALGAGPNGNMPSALPKASIALAKSIFALDDIAKAEIEAVSTLLKKN